MLFVEEAKDFAPVGYIYDENDNLFYYKLVDEDSYGLEIIMERLAKKVGINCASYKIIDNGKEKYYISEDIGKGGCFFTAGDIGIKNDDLLDEINDKIQAHFYNEQLTKQLYKIYFFDILLMNSDRSNGNYGIRSKNDNNDLYILDNEFALELSSEVLINYEMSGDAKSDLDLFLSDNPEYIQLFIEMWNSITPDVLLDSIEEVEKECCHRLPKKKALLAKYRSNYDMLGKILLKNMNVLRLKK